MQSRLLTKTALVVCAVTLVACGKGDPGQVASNSKADRAVPAAKAGSGKPTAGAKPAKPAAAPTTAAMAVATVHIRDDLFDATSVEVTKGQAVTWKWEGKDPHNVDGPGFRSKIQTSGSFTKLFDKPGSFDYRCNVHPTMHGTVVVTG